MKIFTERLYNALENELYMLSLQKQPECHRLKGCVKACRKAMTILKRYISNFFFNSLEDEICFFKQIKPLFYSQYIYYISVYNFHIKRPTGSKEDVEQFITSELSDLKRFFDNNRAFYQYYRLQSTYSDNIYFTRSGLEIYTDLEDYQADEMFSTSHDYKLSKVIANERFQEYLHQQLIEKCNDNQALMGNPITWTSNQTDLVELIYALVECGAFNNGNVEIKGLMDYFQHVFQVDLKYYYRKYTNITQRKKERTAFLDRLKLSLIRKMDEKYALDTHSGNI